MSLLHRLEATKTAPDPFQALYAIAKQLRDNGTSQLELYRLITELYDRHRSDEDPSFFNDIANVLDCVWCGGWGKELDLFDKPLTRDQVQGIATSLSPHPSQTGRSQLTIRHPAYDLSITVDESTILQQMVDFFQTHLNQQGGAELRLGFAGEFPVFLEKDGRYVNRFYFGWQAGDDLMRFAIRLDELEGLLTSISQALDQAKTE